MNFDNFSKQIIKIENLPLPGDASHYKMEPEARRKWRENKAITFQNAKKAAVLALFYPGPNQATKLLFMLRKQYPGVHSNQVGFPGGKVEDEDLNLEETAKRETYEEVGIPPADIKIVKSLSTVYIPPSNFLVQPFIALLEDRPSFSIDPIEVEELIEVRFTDLMNPDNLIMQRLSTSYATKIRVPAFKLNGYTIWGATAMMVSEIKDLIEKVL
ncbi:MAG: CoA pyrophosphatase [Bacteroidota bacterium]